MHEETQSAAWLEQAGGERASIRGNCSIGRSPSNQIVFSDEKVSRRHAVIHAQDQNEFWLVDLGSINGTYLNGRRVTQSVQLRDQDRIEVGQFRLVFRQPLAGRTPEPEQTDADKTIHEIKSSHCWLLVADIQASTLLSRQLSPDELPVVTGRWFDTCKRILDAWGGSIDKYLGDGFFAYWPAQDQAAEDVVRALEELKKVQTSAQPPFRLVVHYGRVFLGGLATMGGARLFGPEVNFTFRLERLASNLGKPCLLSDTARAELKSHLEVEEIGSHEMPGFDGQFLVFSF